MSRLTRAQIRQIKSIIQEHMDIVMMIMVGGTKPSPRLLRKLNLPKNLSDLISDSYRYGRLNIIEGRNLSSLSKMEVDKLLSKVRINKAQEASIDYLKTKVATQIDTITQRITNNIITNSIQNDLSLWDAVGEVIPKGIAQNSPRYNVVQQLREYSKDLERDWHRVAHTEMWGAKCMGEVQAILNNESPLSQEGADTKVYMKPSPLACSKCFDLYLERDRKTPKVFSLSELLQNGNNYNKKQADWVACVPPSHPNCMCTINVMPKNTKFDENGNLVLNLD